MAGKIADWSERFEATRAEATKPGSPVSPDVVEKLESCKASIDAASAKLRELRATAARWGELRAELETIWKDMETALDDATPGSPARKAAGLA